MNIDDIRREIDGLYTKSTRKACEDFTSALAAYWPTISAALADLDKALTDNCNERDALMEEVQLLRRKAAAFDAINSGDVMVREWWVLGSDRFMLYVNRDLLTAIEAALAAKENKQ